MSKTLSFATKIVDSQLLKVACDAMRESGLEVTGPRKDQWPHPRRSNVFIDGHCVTLPGWTSPCIFKCNAEGEMFADNYSDYDDERAIDPRTGERIPGTGNVHPKVLSGEKRVGDDGRWGNIRELDRLQAEYTAAVVVKEAQSNGYQITKQAMDGVYGGLELTIDVPDMVGSM